jgi:RNA polymerase sigma factor (sigma-70 family)
VSAPEGERVGTRSLIQPVPSDLEAFYQAHQDTWLRYAYTQTGTPEAAEQIVDSVTAQLADLWEYAAERGDPGRYAWAVLKTTIVRWLNDNQARPAFIETVTFDRVALAMNFVREQFNLIEESLTLYTAISRLPERQYDVLVLHYVLGYPAEQVAQVVGIDPADVGVHIRAAKQRLTHELGRQPAPHDE